MQKDYNNLKQWLVPLMDARRISTEDLAIKAKVSRRVLYFWMDDTARPSTKSIARVVDALNELPVYVFDKNSGKYVPVHMEVRLEDALKQYVERRSGRPRGASGGSAPVTTRSRRQA